MKEHTPNSPSPRVAEAPAVASAEGAPAWLELVATKVASLQYGAVQVVVHDGRVVQVESTERHRFDVRRSG